MFKTDVKELSSATINFKKCSGKFSPKNFLKSTKTSMVKSVKEFCKNSTLHGLSYLANKDLCIFERAFFAISFVTVVIIAGFFISNVYNKWCTTPVLFCINPQPTHIKNEPFPALTICNVNQAYKTNVMKFEKNSTAYATTQMLCQRDVNTTVANSVIDWSFMNDFITNISQPCENMLLGCRYGGINYNCSDLFYPIVSDEGLCCSFNMVHPKFMYKNISNVLNDEFSRSQKGVYSPIPWTPERGYPPNLPHRFSPFKSAGIGESRGLSVILNVEADEYYCTTSNSFGFKMVLHSPTETPCVKEVGLILAAGYEAKARVRIEKLQSDPMLHRINIKYRQCLFQEEGNLTYYASYTQHNCMMECTADLLMRHCGCVPHFMPRRYGNETVCSFRDVDCLSRLDFCLAQNADIHSDDNCDNDDNSYKHCDDICLPSCSDLKYYVEFFSTPLSNAGFSNKILRNFSNDYIKRNIALMTVYYKDISFRSNIQTEFIGMTDVLSSVGGLIGLFFGFSFISLAEIIFYSCIRPCRKSLTKIILKKPRSLSSTSTVLIKSPSTFQHPYKAKKRTFKNASAFRVSSKVATISPNFNIENISTDYNYIPNFKYNMKLSQQFPKSNSKPPGWGYD